MSTTVGCRIVLSLMLFAVLSNPLLKVAAQSSEAADTRPVEFAMKNVTYHYSEPVAVHIAKLQGQLITAKSGATVFFDDKNSFSLRLNYAEISISCNALAQVLNENVFSSSDAPIKKLSIESKNNQLIMKGKLPQKADVAFETVGTLSADPDGRIRVHSDHVKAAHLPVKGLMDLLGLDIAGLIDTKKVHGITAEKDDLILDSEQILPPPHIQGKVTAVRLQGNEIVLTCGWPHLPNFAAKEAGNYIAVRRSDIRFGKLTRHHDD